MNRSRAAILPFPGDPYLLNYWLGLYDRFWKPEIDKLYIYLNSPIEAVMVDYMKARIAKSNEDGKIILLYEPVQIEHGAAINKTLDHVTEENIMLIEDDGFIFRPGIVNYCFEQIESGRYDIVGGKRGSCTMEILTRANELWQLPYEGEGDQGPNFWPCFFFIKKEILLKTDRQFSARAWHRGEIIPELDNYVVQDELIASDTMVHMSLQLRSIVAQDRILCIPQYHGHPDDVDHYEKKYKFSMFNGMASWCHIGSLSSGVGGILRDSYDRPLTLRFINPPKEKTILPVEWCQSDFQKREFERRVQWWATFFDQAESTPETKEFYDLYSLALMRIIHQFGLSASNIHRRQQIYKTLGL